MSILEFVSSCRVVEESESTFLITMIFISSKYFDAGESFHAIKARSHAC